VKNKKNILLLVDDNPDDIELTLAALATTKLAESVVVVKDGIEAMQYLRREADFHAAIIPSLVLLDLNMPRKDGREVLAEMKEDPQLRKIPVVVLTTSETEEDVSSAYRMHANSYVSKPVELHQFISIAKCLEEYWFRVSKLPVA
jgi:chemotaxis family two-component system response regulator Rcp1